MRPLCHTPRISHAGAAVLCLLLLLAGVAAVAAQENVHEWLEQRLGPGPSKGSATAPVLIEEFSDFQCAYCGKFTRETLPRLIQTYIDTGKVRLVYRHFAVLGPDSVRAAEAAACAGDQGKFWPYHDRLFAMQGQIALTHKNLLRLAQALALDVTDFGTCLETGRFASQVQAETNAAATLGLRGTPGFMVNGRPLVGALPFELFQSTIDEALRAAASGSQDAPEAGQATPPGPERHHGN